MTLRFLKVTLLLLYIERHLFLENFEKFKVHCIKNVNEADVNMYKVKDVITFKSVGKCSVWGDYAS